MTIKKRLPNNWRNRIEIIYEECGFDNHMFSLQFIRRKTPKGFQKQIGFLEIGFDKGIPYIQESKLYNNYFKNRGLGTMLYAHALKKYGVLSTNYHEASEEARRVWMSLIKKHRYSTDFFGDNHTLIVYHMAAIKKMVKGIAL